MRVQSFGQSFQHAQNNRKNTPQSYKASNPRFGVDLNKAASVIGITKITIDIAKDPEARKLIKLVGEKIFGPVERVTDSFSRSAFAREGDRFVERKPLPKNDPDVGFFDRLFNSSASKREQERVNNEIENRRNR